MPYYLVNENGNLISKYPIFTGILATPIYFVPLVLNKIPGLDYHEHVLKVLLLGRVSASVIASFSVVVFYLILKSMINFYKLKSNSNFWIYFFTAFYAFGTVTLSISSRTLWQHTSAQLMISLAVLFLLWSLNNPRFVKWIGLLLGMAVLSRPTTILIALIISIYVFLFYRKEFLKYIYFVIPSILFLIIYNYSLFGSPFVEGYQAAGDTTFTFNTLEGLLGLLFSPNRGLLFLSPPLILGFFYSLIIIIRKIKEFKSKGFLNQNNHNNLFLILSLSIVSYFLLMASWYCWWGGDSFGYRMVTEVLPILGLFSFIVILSLNKYLKYFAIITCLYSFYVHSNVVYFGISRCETQNAWDFECIYPTKDLLKKLGL